jgi:hypothetical protein
MSIPGRERSLIEEFPTTSLTISFRLLEPVSFVRNRTPGMSEKSRFLHQHIDDESDKKRGYKSTDHPTNNRSDRQFLGARGNSAIRRYRSVCGPRREIYKITDRTGANCNLRRIEYRCLCCCGPDSNICCDWSWRGCG